MKSLKSRIKDNYRLQYKESEIPMKKTRSAKQRANDRRLGQLAKARHKTSPTRTKVKTITRRVSKMVRKKVKTRSKKRGENPMKLIIPSLIYGATREKISMALQPITSKVPLGNIADELVLGVVGFFVAKKVKNPTLKGIGKAMVVIESARIGEALISQGLSGIGGTSPSTNNNQF